jgi:hypothetical protein
MGLHFSTAMATGVMMKRATHRAAEQARRDRMKTAMVDLAEFLLVFCRYARRRRERRGCGRKG